RLRPYCGGPSEKVSSTGVPKSAAIPQNPADKRAAIAPTILIVVIMGVSRSSAATARSVAIGCLSRCLLGHRVAPAPGVAVARPRMLRASGHDLAAGLPGHGAARPCPYEVSDTVEGDTRVPHNASVMSSTRRTDTPARYISISASSTELSSDMAAPSRWPGCV